MTSETCGACGGPLTCTSVPCPLDEPGCLLVHRQLVCLPCRDRIWRTQLRPATVGELAVLNQKIEVLAEALGLSELLEATGP